MLNIIMAIQGIYTAIIKGRIFSEENRMNGFYL